MRRLLLLFLFVSTSSAFGHELPGKEHTLANNVHVLVSPHHPPFMLLVVVGLLLVVAVLRARTSR